VSRSGLRAGSYGTFGARTLHGIAHGAWDATLAAGSLESRGDFEYLDRHGTLENPSDDRVTTRSNNDFRQSDYLFRITRRARDRTALASASTQALNREAGVPGPENIQTKEVRDRYDRWIHSLRLESPALLDQALRLSARASIQRARDRFSNPAGEVGLGRAERDNRTAQDSWGASASWIWFATGQTLQASWDEVDGRFTPEDILRGRKEFTRRRDATTVTVEDRLRLFEDRVLLDAAYRWVRATDNHTGPPAFGRPPEPFPPHRTRLRGPSLGTRIDLGRNVFCKANRTWTARLPTFFELFGSNGIQDPNTELEPEEGWQADVGLQAELDGPGGTRFMLDLTAFRSRTEKKIALIQNSQRTTKSVNLDESEVEGVEILAEVKRIALPFRGRLGLSLSATLQDARDRGESPLYAGKELPYVPREKADLQISLARGAWHASYALAHESATFRDRFNTEAHRTPARTLHSVILSRRLWSDRIEAAVELANLTDTRTVDAEGYPLPGRSWFASLDFRWE
jgi:iron complex outermembrane receptor protein